MFKITHSDGKSRIGKLKTIHGTIETPIFMPVATKGAPKHITMQELEKSGTQAIISNSFLLYLKPGLEIIKKAEGLHKFSSWKKSIFTDSGGFQIQSEPFFQKTTDDGGYFKSPYDGKTYFLTPEDSVFIQETLGSDVMMCLDEMPLYGKSKQEIINATNRTHEWARRCLQARKNKKHLLFGIIQGGVFPDLRKKSAKVISSMDFDGLSIGGLAVGEKRTEMYKMLKITMPLIPKEKPHYLMGVGSPEDIIEAISQGVDIFDSVFPTQNARHGTLFTFHGKIKITNQKYRTDMKNIDEECDCHLCRNYTRAYLHHIFKMGEPIGLRLASLHNIRFLNRLIENSKKAIKEHRIERYKKEFLRQFEKG